MVLSMYHFLLAQQAADVRIQRLFHLRQSSTDFIVQCSADREIQTRFRDKYADSDGAGYSYNCEVVHNPELFNQFRAVSDHGWDSITRRPTDPKLQLNNVRYEENRTHMNNFSSPESIESPDLRTNLSQRKASAPQSAELHGSPTLRSAVHVVNSRWSAELHGSPTLRSAVHVVNSGRVMTEDSYGENSRCSTPEDCSGDIIYIGSVNGRASTGNTSSGSPTFGGTSFGNANWGSPAFGMAWNGTPSPYGNYFVGNPASRSSPYSCYPNYWCFQNGSSPNESYGHEGRSYEPPRSTYGPSRCEGFTYKSSSSYRGPRELSSRYQKPKTRVSKSLSGALHRIAQYR